MAVLVQPASQLLRGRHQLRRRLRFALSLRRDVQGVLAALRHGRDPLDHLKALEEVLGEVIVHRLGGRQCAPVARAQLDPPPHLGV